MRDVLRVVRDLFPGGKTAPAFKSLTGLSLRQCEDICSERSGISTGTLRLLLRTPAGFEILRAYVAEPGEPDPEWLIDCAYYRQSIKLKADIAEAKARLRETEKQRKRR